MEVIAFSSKQGQPLEVPDFFMKKQERIESAQKRIQELKKLIDHWLKNEQKNYLQSKD